MLGGVKLSGCLDFVDARRVARMGRREGRKGVAVDGCRPEVRRVRMAVRDAMLRFVLICFSQQ